MKKITIVLVVSGILMACQKEDNVCLFNANEHSPITKNISIEEAIQIAKEGALMLEDSLFTRFHNVRSVDCKNTDRGEV